MSAKPDLEQIVPPLTEPLEVGGVPCRVRRIRTRELLALMNVLVIGGGHALGEARRMLEDDDQDVADTLIALMLHAIPNAADETLMMIRVLVEPMNRDDQKKLTPHLINPDIDVLVDVMMTVVMQEREDLADLLGKVRKYLKTAGRMPIPR